MIRVRQLMTALVAAMLAACSSAPVHYYTLVSAPDSTETENGMPPAQFQFELLPIGIPAQDDVPQLVVRQGGQAVNLLNGERWIAPLADEVRNALSVDLSRRLHAQDIRGGLPVDGKPVLRIKVDINRFDSSPGNYALVEATWTIRPLKADVVLTCTSRINQNVGQGYEGLVAGHQQALGELADQIASVAPSLAAGSVPACPVR
ncbi:PqiC family protein [Dyella psychrodurans]|uniref:ABC-type transport auxiliary lipoprotein component domain-containing protein n=1 Tax=Dyella psychrodurans TaxID=1927960 RepID=A0A370XB85_9GAMM|nr:PqiC family protein [Dyella psychrodurans]RDS85521.1 hypothetical protein DWU99_08425 [Dyella psychrodurans]